MKTKSLPITAIHVTEGRQRQNLGDLKPLAASILLNGLINPITVTKDGELLAGERRFEACKLLEWETIPCSLSTAETELEKQRVEFDENAKRQDLHWIERVKAVAKFHKLAGNSVASTIEALGISRNFVYQNLSVAEYISEVSEMANFITAVNYVQRKKEREKEAALASIAGDPLKAVADLLVGGGGPVAETPDLEAPAPTPNAEVLCDDFTQWAKDYSEAPFNLIHCDFPYGVKAGEKTGQGSARYAGEYTDDAETYLRLLDFFCEDMGSVIAPQAHLIFWFDMGSYFITAKRLREAGWVIFPHPLIWFKEDNRGIIPDAGRQFRRVYETAFFGCQGDRKIIQTTGNCTPAATDTGRHPSCKPVRMLKHFFEPLVDGSTRFLDPTCGGGTSLKSALDLGASYCLGIERDLEWANSARTFATGQTRFITQEAVALL